MSQMLNPQFNKSNLSESSKVGPVLFDYVEGKRIVLSNYEDDWWYLPDSLFNRNRKKNQRIIKFVDNGYKEVQKRYAYWFLINGRGKANKARDEVLRLNNFFNWLQKYHHNIRLNKISTMLVEQFVQYRKTKCRGRGGRKGVSSRTVVLDLLTLQRLHSCLGSTDMKFDNPFIETSASYMAFGSERGTSAAFKAVTNYIPFEKLTKIFSWCESQIDQADTTIASNSSIDEKWKNNPLLQLRDACIFIILVTTGMRVHELAYIEAGAIKMMGDSNNRYFALHSKSSKTMGTGKAEHCWWYAPDIAVRAIKILETIMLPMKNAVLTKINDLQLAGCDESLTQAKRLEMECVNSLLITYSYRENTFNVMSDNTAIYVIQGLFNKLKLDWKYSTHQTRRTYARLVAKHTFGDLRVLVEQMKHASMDMTAGYGHDDSVDLSILQNLDPELRELIEEEFGMVVAESKLEVATATHLSGGAGRNLVQHRHKTEKWRKNGIAVKTYDDKDLAQILESTPLFGRGHAYCMNDQGPCDSFDCVNCDSGVITLSHMDYWKALWQQQNELLAVSENNPQIKAVVEYNQQSAKQVFSDLGVDMSEVESAA